MSSQEENKTEAPQQSDSLSGLINVQPAAQIISYCEIECRVVLHRGLFALVHAYDANKVKIKIYQVELSPTEYETWTSDTEMEALILSKCNLSKV